MPADGALARVQENNNNNEIDRLAIALRVDRDGR